MGIISHDSLYSGKDNVQLSKKFPYLYHKFICNITVKGTSLCRTFDLRQTTAK